MNTDLPIWLTNLSSIGSLLGLLLTLFLLVEAKKIRSSFLRRARLPEVVKELSRASSKLSKSLKDWDNDSRTGIEQLSIIKGLLDNLYRKLPSDEKKKLQKFTKTIEIKKFYIFKRLITNATNDEAWVIYNDLVGLITTLEQLQKDTKWD